MDTDTKRSLGGALMGLVVVLIGLALRFSGPTALEAVGAILLIGGGLVTVICLAQVGIRLMRAESTGS